MRIVIKYLLAFAAFFSGVGETLQKCHRLPTVIRQPVNVFLSLFGRDIKQVFKGRSYNSIINPVKGWLSHCAVQFEKSTLAFFDIHGVPGKNFGLNFLITYFRTGFKYPILNRVPGYEMNGFHLIAGIETVSQFTDQFAGINDSRCQPHREGENILNNDNEFRRPREAQDSSIYRNRFFIKTIAYRPIS
jgi:hypothetical protein